MAVIYTRDIETPLGLMRLGMFEGRLVLALWLTGDPERETATEIRVARLCRAEGILKGPHDLALEAEVQIMQYLNGFRDRFDLPIRLVGTKFQEHVWRQLSDVGYGTVMSYGDLAAMSGRPNGARAIGAAVGANPLHLIIPCHRIVEKSGGIGGYAGGLDVKRELIRREKLHRTSPEGYVSACIAYLQRERPDAS